MELNHLPHSPGVYLMRDHQSKIIYIGKANDLRKRVSSYFQKIARDAKIDTLVSFVREIDFIPAASERDSLLLEQKLIRKFQPLYNTMWRDDKSYPYIKLTSEDYPRLILTRQKKNDGGRYFGPYPNVSMVKKLLRMLWRKKMLPLRLCRFPFEEKEIAAEGGLEKTQPAMYRKVKSCIYLHTGQCPAPCVGRISKEDYGEIARNAELFFEGDYGKLKQVLEKEMKSASENLNYEKAALLRDQVTALDHLAERIMIRKVDEQSIAAQIEKSRAIRDLQEKLHLPSPPMRIEAFDISNIQSTEPVGSMVVFESAGPLKSDYRKFKIKTVQGQDDFAMMGEVVYRRYRRILREGKKLPDLVVIDGGKGQLSAAMESLQKLKSESDASRSSLIGSMRVISLAKQNEEIFLPKTSEPIVLPKNSQALHILQAIRDEAHRFAVTFHRLRRTKATFGAEE